MEEMRKFPRLDMNVGVQWSRVKEEAGQKGSVLDVARNISAGGICLIVNEKIEIGDRLVLDIELPNLKTIHAKGLVVWTKSFSIIGVKNDERFDAGIEFTDISDLDREEIKKFVFAFL